MATMAVAQHSATDATHGRYRTTCHSVHAEVWLQPLRTTAPLSATTAARLQPARTMQAHRHSAAVTTNRTQHAVLHAKLYAATSQITVPATAIQTAIPDHSETVPTLQAARQAHSLHAWAQTAAIHLQTSVEAAVLQVADSQAVLGLVEQQAVAAATLVTDNISGIKVHGELYIGKSLVI